MNILTQLKFEVNSIKHVSLKISKQRHKSRYPLQNTFKYFASNTMKIIANIK